MNNKDYFEAEEFQEENVLCMKLTPEVCHQVTKETQIALSFLKRRFPNYPIEKIVSTLDHYVHKNQQKHHENRNIDPQRRRQEDIITFPNNQNQHRFEGQLRQPETNKKRDFLNEKQQTIKLIAKLFCESGYDLKKLQTYLPQISGVHYRNYLLSMMNSILKQVLNIVKQNKKYEKELSHNEKYNIKRSMISAHEWMALKDMKIFQTFLKLINKKVLNKKYMITLEEIADLYHLLISRIRFQCVDTTDIENHQAIFGDQIENITRERIKHERPIVSNINLGIIHEQSSLRKDYKEQRLIVQAFIRFKAINLIQSEVSKVLNKQKRFTMMQIQEVIINIIQKSLKDKIQKYLKEKTFGEFELIQKITDRTAQRIYDYGTHQLKTELLKIYLYPDLNISIFSKLISLLNLYFSQNQLFQQDEEQFDEILAHVTQFKDEELYFNVQERGLEMNYERQIIENNLIKIINDDQLSDRQYDLQKIQKETNALDQNSIQYLIS